MAYIGCLCFRVGLVRLLDGVSVLAFRVAWEFLVYLALLERSSLVSISMV